MPLRTYVLILMLVGLVSLDVTWSVADEVNFNRDIRPILSDRCFACHGPNDESNESGLRLDVGNAAQAELPSGNGFAIIPGDASNSELMNRILSDDDSNKMPPTDSHLSITRNETALLQKWIEQGAVYSEHWSFVSPARTEPPDIPHQIHASNEIDRFVFNRLIREGLKPSPPAERSTLIRRLSLDLIGLPPGADEVVAFVGDDRPDACEHLVNRLLENPHFGERMALDWLDAARYADTNGYSIDGGRHLWLWRDWVIHAFNTNKPYDEFLIEQIAGDLLPDATPARLIATGFQRNNMVTHEGGTIAQENLTNYNADRVKTLGESVLGLTLGCAQCHDHKYDPITQKDYYGLFAFFNTLGDVGLDGDRGVNPRPYVKARTVLQTGEQDLLMSRIEKLKKRLSTHDPPAFADWELQQQRELKQRTAGMKLLPLQIHKISTPNRGSGFKIEDRRFVRITQPGGSAAYDLVTRFPVTNDPITGLRVAFQADEATPGGGWGYGKLPGQQAEQPEASSDPSDQKGTFVLTSISISAGEVASDQVDLFRLLKTAGITANSWQAGFRPELCLDMRNLNGWSPDPTHEGPVHLTVTFDQPIDVGVTPFVTTQLNFGSGNNLIAARMELFAMTGVDDDCPLPADIIAALNIPKLQRSSEQKQSLLNYFAAHAPQTRRLRTELENARERLRVLTEEFSTMVMKVAEKPRDTYILNRGDYSQPTTRVEMQTPDCLPRCDVEPDGRLSLANWITMPNHPLTARVYVNRVWQIMFGAGIVRTPADFGSQGQWPSHPQLLDWLAVEFVESGWDVKALVKTIAMSETYRQSSKTSQELIERDPQNILLARGPRFRLPAEFIRDSALKVSGLFESHLGGPSVNPYAPGDLWREISHYGSTPATAQTFVQDHGEKLYRRSLYTYWKRTSPPPNMAAFDAPNREVCVVSRPVTNTPLQALVILNDVQFVEAARALAERIIQHDRDDQARIRWAILESLSRQASEKEVDVLTGMLSRERKRYRDDLPAARLLLNAGESLRDHSIPAHEHAAWTQLASTILNLSEFLTRN